MANKKEKAEEINTPAVRVQFVHVFAPYTPPRRVNDPTFKPKYELVLLFDKGDSDQMAGLDRLKDLAAVAAEAKFGENWASKGIRSPFRDADEEDKAYDGYPDHIFVRASSQYAPKIIDLAEVPIESPEQVYAGCWMHARVHAFAYDNESAGVSIGLGNLLFVKDDDKFKSGGSDPTQDFADLTTPATGTGGGNKF